MMKKTDLHKKINPILMLIAAIGGGGHSQDVHAAETGLLKGLIGKKPIEPLPPEQAFQVTARWADAQRVSIQFNIKPDYYLYKDRVTVEINGSTPGIRLTQLNYPAPITKQDKSFGPVQVYSKSFEIQGLITGADKFSTPITLVARYQGCFEPLGVCYPPQISEMKLNPSGNMKPGTNIPAKTQP
jgi:thiol:disulfide interchange protein DsbD